MRAQSTTVALAVLGLAALPGSAAAQAPPHTSEARDDYDLAVHSETHAELFRRALLPGPSGALVEAGAEAPVYEYLRLRARRLDTSWQKDGVDVELAAWGRAGLAGGEAEQRFDGDVQTANAGYEQGPLSLRLGRQHVAGGAARYARFDGLRLGALLGAGLDIEAYGGLTVLPRWDARPGYHQLGAAADSLLREPEALPEPERSGQRLAGGRIGWTARRSRAGASFHEQHEAADLGRRSFGVDGRASVSDDVALGGSGVLELDAGRVSDGRLWLDAAPARELDVSAEVLHAEPALFLSRQSVLSVFSTDAYEDLVGSARLHATRRLTLEGSGSVQLYDATRRGGRGEIAARVLGDARGRTHVRLGYARVLAVDNGYNSLRLSLSHRIVPAVSGTLEAYAYLYDAPILERSSSEIYSGTLAWQVSRVLGLSWGASLAQSPYASFDAQTLARVSCDFDLSAGGAER